MDNKLVELAKEFVIADNELRRIKDRIKIHLQGDSKNKRLVNINWAEIRRIAKK